MSRVFFAAIIVGGLVLSSICLGYSGGTGEPSNPYKIATVSDWQQLMNAPADWGKYFKQTADINFATAGDINGIGNMTTRFTGTFDGDGHIISNITISQSPDSYNSTAMFRRCVSGATIKDLTVTGATVVGTSPNNTQSYSAILVGENAYGSIISNCNVNGALTHTHTMAGKYAMAGIIAGANNGTVIGCTASGTVSATATTGSYLALGGIVGEQAGGKSSSQIGTVENCTSTVTITNLTADPNIACYVGGIVGILSASVSNANEIRNCHYNGTINFSTTRTNTTTHVGGIVGNSNGAIAHSSSRGNIDANSAGTSAGSAVFDVGGICGFIYNTTVDNSFADCDIRVNYGDVAKVGGAFGVTQSTAINNCYARGSLFDVKHNSSTLYFNYGGGFTGYFYLGAVTNCWCATDTFGAGNAHIKGFGTSITVTPTGCFWDKTTSGITAANTGATGKTTAEMQTLSTFTSAGWDFVGETANGTEDIWRMCIDGVNYPLLWWQFNAADFTCPDGVDFIDFAIFANAWLSDPTQVNWNGRCDIAEPPDNVIDILDLAIFAQHWLE
jgi:hypothetical protein